LAVAVAIIAIVAAVAVPSFTNLTRRNRLSSAANEMVTLLQIARGAAISQRASATVCPSSSGSACTASVGSRWIALSTKSGANTLLREANLPTGITVRASTNLSGASNKFTFTPDGFSAVGTSTSGTIGLCSSELSGNNAVDVSASVGRVSTRRRAATSACTNPGDN
jgi:type IV fimbrial biogenesis protein FimT